MSLERCREAFERSDDERVAAVNRCSPIDPCACENFTASELSPGRVDDTEDLHFLVSTPEGRFPNGYLNPALVIQSQKKGLSVLRSAAANSEFEETAIALVPWWKTRDKHLDGIMTFQASAVRYRDGVRFCGVYDTGMENKPHHADVMMTGFESLTGSQRKKRLKDLVDAIGNDFENIDNFREGSLSHIKNEMSA